MSGLTERHRQLVEDYRWLWELIAGAAGGRSSVVDVASVTLPDDPDARRAVADLLGDRSVADAGTRLDLARVERVLRALPTPTTVADMVQAVGGFAPSRPDRRRRVADERDAITDDLIARLPDRFTGWAEQHARTALARTAGGDSVAAQRHLAKQLVAVANALPADGLPLPSFAQRHAGDTKALDRGTKLGSLAAHMLTGPGQLDAESWRQAWADHGVVADALSSSVLGWRLPLAHDHPAGRVAAAYDDADEPCRLTLRVLRHGVRVVRRPGTLFACENPALVEHVAAEQIDVPLLCYEGTATVAARRIVRAVADAGWRIRIGADLEPGGLRAAITLLADAGQAGEPWRLTAAEHSAGMADARRLRADARVPETPWDPELATLLRHTHQRVTEEARINDLMADLRDAAESP